MRAIVSHGPKSIYVDDVADARTERPTAVPTMFDTLTSIAARDVFGGAVNTGTDDGPLQGNAATGKKIKVRRMQIGRFADGKLAGRWGSSDQLGIMSQLGLVDA